MKGIKKPSTSEDARENSAGTSVNPADWRTKPPVIGRGWAKRPREEALTGEEPMELLYRRIFRIFLAGENVVHSSFSKFELERKLTQTDSAIAVP